MMKNKYLYRIICTMLASILLIQLVGCSNSGNNLGHGASKEVSEETKKIEPMELEEVHTYSFDYIGGTDVMPIMGFFGPTRTGHSYNGNLFPDYYSDEMFELMAGTGINLIGYNLTDYYTSKEDAVRLLEQGDKYNLGILVSDSRIQGETGRNMSKELVDQCINEYANYPAYIGNHIKDEPNHPEYTGSDVNDGTNVADYAHIFSTIQELGFCAYGNLFPITVGPQEGYMKYARDFVETCKVPFLSYDMYPFIENGDGIENATTYFKNLTAIRKVAEEAKIPFWVFIQAGAQWNDGQKRFDSDGYFPSQGQFFWNVGTSLAFGAKGLQYFTLIQPTWFAYAEAEAYDFQRNGLIGAFGNKTRWYYYAQQMNKQIVAVDEVLMNSVNKGVIATCQEAKEDLADSQYLLDGKAWRELADVDGDALIGCFNYHGKTALYVVNYDIENTQDIVLDFVDTYDITVIQNGEEKNLAAAELELTLVAGNSALVVFN